MEVSRNGSVVWDGEFGGREEMKGAGRALRVERNPETDPEFQHSTASSSRIGLGWELILSLMKKHEQQLTRLRMSVLKSKKKGKGEVEC